MRTTKPIGTISFNTPKFLQLKLEELRKAGKISFWCAMIHKPEDDEAGTKEHLHLYIEPSRMLQTDDLRNELKEYDPEHPEKPRGTLTFGGSKFADWYLYAMHDKAYLASKGQSRRYHYTHEEFITSDEDDLLCKARTIDRMSLSPYSAMIDAQKQGITWQEFFRRGTVPLQQVVLFEKAWFLLLNKSTFRNDSEGHDNDI